ncbi:MAG: metallophosphoesterase [Verrucomicrobia bacterium]|nr:metallophosphoesterase [Verrucomicrobiota bacterium]
MKSTWLSGAALFGGVVAGLVSVETASGGALAFTRGPFVQNTTTNSLQILWRTTVPASTLVEYGPTPALGLAVAHGALVTNHVATLTGLAPGATIYYRAGSDVEAEALRSAVVACRTLRPAGPIRIVVIGDSAGGQGITPLPQPMLAARMAEADPDLVMHLGDIWANGFTEAEADAQFFSQFQPHLQTTPYYMCAGNHDLEVGYPGCWCDTQATNFQNTFSLPTNTMDGTECYYSFDHGDAHLVCLFNPWFVNYVFTADTPQYAWLTNDLAQSTKPWKLLFMHQPIADSGGHATYDHDRNGIWDQYDVMNLLLPVAEQYGVQMVFGSHDHSLERFAPTNGLHHCVTAGGGRRLYSVQARHVASAQFYATYHFLRLDLTNDTLSLQAIDTNGLVFDAWTIHQTLPPARLHLAAWHAPVVETDPADDEDGNLTGQAFDFDGPPLLPRAGQFSNLGRVYVNNDATHLYLGLEQVMFYPGNNVFLFLEWPGAQGVPTLANLGNGILDPAGQGADGLDCLDNLSFTNFMPAVACVLGDEHADGQFRDFARAGLALNTGQGVFRLDAGLSDVAGARIQQYNRSPQTGPVSSLNGVTLEANANFIEIALPFSALGGLAPGDVIKLGALVGGGAFDAVAQTRQLDTSALGLSLSGSGQGPVLLEGLSVQLASEPGTVRLSIAPVGDGQYRLMWNAVPGRRYDIEYATQLPDFAPWHAPGLPLTADATTATFTLADPGDTSGFFRVRCLE